MSASELALRGAHVTVTLAVVLVIALLGRLAARALRQPEVIGEIAAGLLAGPAAVAVFGSDTFGRLLPSAVLAALKVIAQVGLVLFLVGLTHQSRLGPAGPSRRAIGWVALGGFVPGLAMGALFGGWVLLTRNAGLRGAAPLSAFLVFVAVAMSVSAVPVLARIMADRGISHTPVGRLALASAVLMDTAGWLLLSVAVGLSSGSPAGFLRSMTVLTAGALAALGIRRILRTSAATGMCARRPRATAVLLAGVALTTALGAERLGVSVIFGAVIVGLAIPADGDARWAVVVSSVSRAGRALVPAFFVVTGVTVLTAAFSSPPWQAMLLATAFGILGKVGGGYLGARLAGESGASASRIGVLLNTRGLTELVVLQVGYHTHILSGALYLAFVLMALSTTALTGPLLTLLDWTRAISPSLAGVPGTALPAAAER